MPCMSEIQGTVVVPLTRGYHAIIDEADAELVLQYKWCVTGKNGNCYATHSFAKKMIGLHRFLAGADSTSRVTFVNGNTFDCRRTNLRVSPKCSPRKSGTWKRKDRVNETTGYRGVYKTLPRYVALVVDRGTRYFVGSFKTAEEAALAYDKKVTELYGDNAVLNFQKDSDQD